MKLQRHRLVVFVLHPHDPDAKIAKMKDGRSDLLAGSASHWAFATTIVVVS